MPYDIDNNFMYHAPLEGQPERYNAIRAKAKELAELIIQSTPESREQSLALTNLEQSTFWANAAIARNEKPHAAGHGEIQWPVRRFA